MQTCNQLASGKLTALSISLQTLDAFGGISRPLGVAVGGGGSGNNLGSHRVLLGSHRVLLVLVWILRYRRILCRCDRSSDRSSTIISDIVTGTGSPGGRNCSVHGCVRLGEMRRMGAVGWLEVAGWLA